ncbi:MAG: hypothetical protein AABZ47_07535 [Planctomycetota bacterium]
MSGWWIPLMMVLVRGGWAAAEEDVFPTPSDDRWHYPFNFTPGARPFASCFSSVGNITFPLFNDRDGMFLIVWNTAEQIESGRCPRTYGVEAVTVIVTSVAEATWPIDLSTDEWYTFDFNNDGAINRDGIPRGQIGDMDGESRDADPGRPLELFGVGFGANSSAEHWTESSPYYGGRDTMNAPRDPFPFVFQDVTFAQLHVEDNVKGTQNEKLAKPVFQFTPGTWAIGVPTGYLPGRQLNPFQVVYSIDLSLSEGAVGKYFQQQLDGGRVFVYVTSLQETVIFGNDPAALPTFFTKEGVDFDPLAMAPQLIIRHHREASGDADGDCRSTLDDWGALLHCSSGPDSTPSPTLPWTVARCRESFDFDRDLDVDLRDVSLMLEVFQSSGS